MIRLLIESLSPGGSERVAVTLANHLGRTGTPVEVLMVREEGALLAHLDPAVARRGFARSRAVEALVPVASHLRRGPRGPVLVFGFHLAAIAIFSRRLGLHDCPIVYREGSSPLANVPRRLRWVYPAILSAADRVVAQTGTARRELVSLGIDPGRVTVIPNPGVPPADGIRAPRNEATRDPLLLAVGRLAPVKGFDRLIRGFAALHRSEPGTRLVIVGEGTERSRLEHLVASLGLGDAVELPGFQADVAAQFRRADLFVLSSHYEGQSNALIEAILHGCPVLCAAGRGGTAELLGACGLEAAAISDSSFEAEFVTGVRRSLAAPAATWADARSVLSRLLDPAVVHHSYLDVLHRAMTA